MAVTYGFYNAIDGDRTYDAEDMSRFFDGIFTDGIFVNYEDALAVTPATGMNVTVGVGRAWFDHTWTYNNAPLVLPVIGSDQILSRIDAVVIEVNKNTAVRANDIKVVQGIPASNPERPTMIDDQNHKQYPIAYITVSPGVTELGSSAITDNRGTETCPYAASVIDNTDLIIQNVLREFKDTYAEAMTYNGLDYSVAGKVLDARQGKALDEKISEIRQSFQGGCNSLVAALTSNGYAPASNSIVALTNAINNLRGRVQLADEGVGPSFAPSGGTWNHYTPVFPKGSVVAIVAFKRGRGWNQGSGDHTGVFYQVNFSQNVTYLYNPGTTGWAIHYPWGGEEYIDTLQCGIIVCRVNNPTSLYLQINGIWCRYLAFMIY